MINKHGSGRNTAFRHVGLLLEIVSVYHKLDEDFDHNDRYYDLTYNSTHSSTYEPNTWLNT